MWMKMTRRLADESPLPMPSSGPVRERAPAWLRALLWVSVAVLVVTMCVGRVSAIRFDDDNLYLDYWAQSDPSRAEPLESRLIERVRATPGCEAMTHRLSLRQRYGTNYAGYLAVQHALQTVAEHVVPHGPPAIIAGTIAVKALFFLVMTAALFALGWRVRERPLALGIVLAFLLLAAADIATHWLPSYVIVDVDDPARAAWQVAYSLFFPASALSTFGITPRNPALLLFSIAVVLLWRRQWVAASVAILLMSPLHQTYASVGLALFSVTALIAVPEAFAPRAARIALCLAGLVYLYRERLFAGLGPLPRMASAAALLGVAFLGFSIAASPRFLALRRRFLGGWAERPLVTSAAVLSVFAVTIGLGSLLGNALSTAPTYHNMWAESAGRIGSFARLPVAIAIITTLLARPAFSSARRQAWLYAGATLASLLLAAHAARPFRADAWQRCEG
ncbi:MAG: hypothetical protein RL033_3465, partial [Pseudomonadota bacterium]